MKVSTLKAWDLFYNTNGYLTLVYREDKQNLYVINHNGSLYEIRKDTSKEYPNKGFYEGVNIFFEAFPEYKLDPDCKKKYERIKNFYFSNFVEIGKLLLITT